VESQKVVVTGGAGFIGSALVDQLVDFGHEVISVDNLLGGYRRNVNKDCKFFKMDLRSFDNVDRIVKGADVIFHLAAYAAEGQSIFSPIAINDINITPMNNLLVAAVNHGVSRFVFTSSMAVYGNQKPPFAEDLPRKPIDPYGIGKAYCEAMLEAFAEAYGFEFVILRPHNVYGPRQNIADSYRNVIGIWMNRIMRGRPPIIYGDGKQTRAFSYIEDIAPAIARSGFLSEAANQIINIGSSRKTSINEACDVLSKMAESRLRPTHETERPLEVKHAWCTADKSIKLLGYRTRFPLGKGVAKMWGWAKKIGPQEPTYTLPLEIKNKAPRVWLAKTM
jgi:UDP-glucose 4-epimerase